MNLGLKLIRMKLQVVIVDSYEVDFLHVVRHTQIPLFDSVHSYDCGREHLVYGQALTETTNCKGDLQNFSEATESFLTAADFHVNKLQVLPKIYTTSRKFYKILWKN